MSGVTGVTRRRDVDVSVGLTIDVTASDVTPG